MTASLVPTSTFFSSASVSFLMAFWTCGTQQLNADAELSIKDSENMGRTKYEVLF